MSLFKREKNKARGIVKKSKISRTEAPLDGKSGNDLIYCIGNLQGVGARERQEDSFLPYVTVWAV